MKTIFHDEVSIKSTSLCDPVFYYICVFVCHQKNLQVYYQIIKIGNFIFKQDIKISIVYIIWLHNSISMDNDPNKSFQCIHFMKIDIHHSIMYAF